MCLIYLMSLCQKMAHSVTFLICVFVLENEFYSIRSERRSASTIPAIQWWVRILRDDCGTLLRIISRIWLVNERFWKQHDTSKWYFNFQRNRCMCWFWFWFSLWFWIERISTKRAEQSIARIVRVDCESNHAFRIKINQHKQPQRETVKTAGLPITVDNQAHTQCLAIGNTSKTWALILYASFDAIIISAKPFQ